MPSLLSQSAICCIAATDNFVEANFRPRLQKSLYENPRQGTSRARSKERTLRNEMRV